MVRQRRRAVKDTVEDIPGDATDRVLISDLGGATPTGRVSQSDLGGETARVMMRADDLDSPTNRLMGPELAAIIVGTRPADPVPPTKLAVGTRPPPPPVPHADLAPTRKRRRSLTEDADATQKRRASDPSTPKYLGGYRITGQLAKGGMGVVYRAQHPNQRRSVAIKAIHGGLQSDPAVVARFFAESVAIARVIHPNVIRFFDFGYDAGGSAYLVMELLAGETLATHIARERRLSISMAVDIACQIAQGLVAAHKNGVVHRDLKPDNIFLCPDPNDAHGIRVKLLDFGVAKVEGQGPTHTHQGDLLGTPAYMSPEQGRSASESDARSDLYSVGCILFEMLCGVVPFPGNLVETLVAHQTAQRPPARALNASVPLEVDAVLDRLLARDPEKRPQTATELVCTLSRIEANLGRESVMPRAPTVIVARPLAHTPVVVIAALVVLMAALGIVALLLAMR